MKWTEKDCSSIELVVTEKGRERRVIAESVEQIGRAEKRRANKAESGGGCWETRAEKRSAKKAERARKEPERSRAKRPSCDLPAGVHFLGFRILNP